MPPSSSCGPTLGRQGGSFFSRSHENLDRTSALSPLSPALRWRCVGGAEAAADPAASGARGAPTLRRTQRAPSCGRWQCGGTVTSSPVVVGAGANGPVGAAVCRALVERSAQVRAVVRCASSAPALHAVNEPVGDFADEGLARVVTQAPTRSSRRSTRWGRPARCGTGWASRARRSCSSCRDAGVARLVHVSTAVVHDPSAGVGAWPRTVPACPRAAGTTPIPRTPPTWPWRRSAGSPPCWSALPAIMGADTSVWNALRPQAVRRGSHGRATAGPRDALVTALKSGCGASGGRLRISGRPPACAPPHRLLASAEPPSVRPW